MNNIHNTEQALSRAGIFGPQQSEWSWPTCPSAGQGSRRVARLSSLEGLGCQPRLLRARSISSSERCHCEFHEEPSAAGWRAIKRKREVTISSEA